MAQSAKRNSKHKVSTINKEADSRLKQTEQKKVNGKLGPRSKEIEEGFARSWTLSKKLEVGMRRQRKMEKGQPESMSC
jgi:hypothetical protein